MKDLIRKSGTVIICVLIIAAVLLCVMTVVGPPGYKPVLESVTLQLHMRDDSVKVVTFQIPKARGAFKILEQSGSFSLAYAGTEWWQPRWVYIESDVIDFRLLTE